MIVLKISGDNAGDLFAEESGGHRWQRIPPTERQGRVHSSTITVAVFSGDKKQAVEFRESDVDVQVTRGHGPGGQNRNKVSTAVRAVHRPTGVMVFAQAERSQKDNLRVAMQELRRRIEEANQAQAHQEHNHSRKTMIGRGERSDKIRTVQIQNCVVTNHKTGRKAALAAYLKGDIWSVV